MVAARVDNVLGHMCSPINLYNKPVQYVKLWKFFTLLKKIKLKTNQKTPLNVNEGIFWGGLERNRV